MSQQESPNPLYPLPEPEVVQQRRQIMLAPAHSICHTGWDAFLLTGLLRQLLLQHFSTPSQLSFAELRQFVWTPNPETSKIVIDSVDRWNPAQAEVKPAILIKRNAFRSVRLLVDDKQERTPNADKHVCLWVGSHTVFVAQRRGAPVELLAREVQQQLTQFGPVIRAAYGLQRFQVIDFGEASDLEESQHLSAVPIVVGSAYSESWTLSEQALPLKAVSLETRSR